MTYAEAEAYFMQLIDSANAAPFDTLDVERFFSLAIQEAANEWYAKAELNQEYRDNLTNVLRSYDIPSSTSVIETDTIASPESYWKTVGISMGFTVPSGSVATTNITRNVTLCKPEELYSRRQDTLRKDTPYAPFFVETTNSGGDNIIRIYSGGTLNNDGELMYYTLPTGANSSAPNDPLTNLADFTHQRIVYRAARMALESIGDPKYATFINEFKLNQ